VAATFWCGAFDPALSSTGCAFSCVGRVPAQVADQPACGTSVGSIVATSSTVCAIQSTNGFLYCFADDIAPIAAAAAAQGLPTATPAGASPLRAILIRVNTTFAAASETLICVLFAGRHPNVACLGAATDAVVVAAGGFGALAAFATTRGGARGFATDAATVSVANEHACIIDRAASLFCWGAAASRAAVAAANARANASFALVACGGRSVCAVNSTSQFSCFGGRLDAFVVSGALPGAVGNSSAVPSAAARLASALAAGVLVVVAAGGSDAACAAVPRAAPVAAALAAACATVARALAVGARALPPSTPLTVCVRGSVASAPIALPAVPGLLALVGCVAALGPAAAAAQPDGLVFDGACAPACVTSAAAAASSTMLAGLALTPSPTLPVACTRVVAVRGPLLASVFNVSFARWSCSDSLLHFDYDVPTAALRNADFAGFDGGNLVAAGVLPAAAVEVEAVGVTIASCAAPVGIASSYVTGQHVGGVVATNSAFASLIVLDQGSTRASTPSPSPTSPRSAPRCRRAGPRTPPAASACG
jgi:hypothetical protein